MSGLGNILHQRQLNDCRSEHAPLTAAGSEDQAVYASIASNYRQPLAQQQAEPVARDAIAKLVALTRAVNIALDDSEERDGTDGREHVIGSVNFDAVCNALEALEELPDNKPGWAMNAADKAEWALRHLSATKPPAVAVPDECVAVASALTSQYMLRNSSGTLYCMHCLLDCENRESHDKDCPVLQARAIVNDSLIAAAPQAASGLPAEMTPAMMRAVQMRSELGAYAAANLSGAYDLFAEFWRVAVEEAQKGGAM